jgi:hypothetical protein
LSIDDLRKRLAAVDASLAEPGALESVIITLQRDPNMFAIAYWRAHEHEVLPQDANAVIMPGIVALLRGQPAEAILKLMSS